MQKNETQKIDDAVNKSAKRKSFILKRSQSTGVAISCRNNSIPGDMSPIKSDALEFSKVKLTDRQSNVKVIARFRPLNKVELV